MYKKSSTQSKRIKGIINFDPLEIYNKLHDRICLWLRDPAVIEDCINHLFQMLPIKIKSRQYFKILPEFVINGGFVDLKVEFEASYIYFSNLTGREEIRNGIFEIYFEVKSSFQSIGSLERQIHFYEAIVKSKSPHILQFFCLVSPKSEEYPNLAEILQKSNIFHIECPEKIVEERSKIQPFTNTAILEQNIARLEERVKILENIVLKS
jgi:hypothetical protein